jgi:hypothetical protein
LTLQCVYPRNPYSILEASSCNYPNVKDLNAEMQKNAYTGQFDATQIGESNPEPCCQSRNQCLFCGTHQLIITAEYVVTCNKTVLTSCTGRLGKDGLKLAYGLSYFPKDETLQNFRSKDFTGCLQSIQFTNYLYINGNWHRTVTKNHAILLLLELAQPFIQLRAKTALVVTSLHSLLSLLHV